MRKSALLFCLLTAASCWAVAPAHAVPIPCTGDRIVKVLSVPADKQPPNRTVDLGFKFPGCFEDGEWVGYIGKSDEYIKLTEASQKWILGALGLKEFPPAPSRWSYPGEALFNEMLIAGALLFGVLWVFISDRIKSKKDRQPTEPPTTAA